MCKHGNDRRFCFLSSHCSGYLGSFTAALCWPWCSLSCRGKSPVSAAPLLFVITLMINKLPYIPWRLKTKGYWNLSKYSIILHYEFFLTIFFVNSLLRKLFRGQLRCNVSRVSHIYWLLLVHHDPDDNFWYLYWHIMISIYMNWTLTRIRYSTMFITPFKLTFCLCSCWCRGAAVFAGWAYAGELWRHCDMLRGILPPWYSLASMFSDACRLPALRLFSSLPLMV